MNETFRAPIDSETALRGERSLFCKLYICAENKLDENATILPQTAL